jgi:hypothetical protein
LACIWQGQCIYCGTEIYIPVAYYRWLWVLTIAIVAVLGIGTYNPAPSGTWFLILLLLLVLARLLLGILIPPWVERGIPKEHVSFSLLYIAFSTVLLMECILLGVAHFVLGGSENEVREMLQAATAPLGLVHPAFWLTSARNFADWSGIFLANSLVDTVVLYSLYVAVHRVLERGKYIQIEINGTESDSEDEQL